MIVVKVGHRPAHCLIYSRTLETDRHRRAFDFVTSLKNEVFEVTDGRQTAGLGNCDESCGMIDRIIMLVLLVMTED